MREVDQYTSQTLGIPEIILMEHAALAIQNALKERFGNDLKSTKGIILAGPGNNGGDALALARILFQSGVESFFTILAVEENENSKLSISCRAQLATLGKLHVPYARKLDEKLLQASDWIVDGLFGTGLRRELSVYHQEMIETVNRYAFKKWIVSIDIPSGLSVDKAIALPIAVQASHTVSLGFLKKGLVTGQGVDYTGHLTLSPIQISRQIPFPVSAFLYNHHDAEKLPSRFPSAHKGSFGHVLVCASEKNKEGACLLSALGAFKSGCGLVTLVGSETQLETLRMRAPIEFMTAHFDEDLLKKHQKDVWVIGPGLGLEKSAWNFLKTLLQSKSRLILDADALTLLAQNKKESIALLKSRKGIFTLMTPHPREAARLLENEEPIATQNRYDTVREISDTYHVSALLKGKGTLIARVGEPILCVKAGDTGLAKGGSGDLLSGVLASLLAQNIPEASAIPLGVYLHGRASELLSEKYGTERASLASDISEMLALAFKELESPR